jgi:hypothetical protein
MKRMVCNKSRWKAAKQLKDSRIRRKRVLGRGRQHIVLKKVMKVILHIFGRVQKFGNISFIAVVYLIYSYLAQ